jgi:hypothetical protein
MKSVHKQVGRWIRRLLTGGRDRSRAPQRQPLRSLDSRELKLVGGGLEDPADHPTKGW